MDPKQPKQPPDNVDGGGRCPQCGHTDAVKESRDRDFEYRGHKTVLKNIHAVYCKQCGSGTCDFDRPEDWDRMCDEITAFMTKIDDEERSKPKDTNVSSPVRPAGVVIDAAAMFKNKGKDRG